jgi:hypothetical protein
MTLTLFIVLVALFLWTMLPDPDRDTENRRSHRSR